ncbi:MULTISPECIES: bifunctional acetate--CoA ligase family protein/GNAT family N-acetyltransferase [Sphingobium]|uniref:bifunctional acetate--CoA ligase family protein/GNAT family N-acetyltransferase n=1 Tax=Sphingobium sp. MI1205 TaxID=407020 RepID=UPI0007706A56|nr:bifunctional acetate--CoA ligase family protein/GNAT family N-acetyltransferase [Sphingobium sp. MI1205]AMK17386.1 CoA-binding domain-containing protein [Sphingobium sp. MI1205]
MTIRNLSPLLHARTIALIGGSQERGAVGMLVLDNLLAGGFDGTVYVVNPHPVRRQGMTWVASLTDLPEAPELAVIMTPEPTVAAIIEQLGSRGTRCAVILTAGLDDPVAFRGAIMEAARRHDLRIVGPNCLGIIAPHARINATFARTPAQPGYLGLISQSGALITAVLDWAQTRGIGFSSIISAGDMADANLGDLIDLLAADPHTHAILLYVEGVTEAAGFMAAARAAALHKPIIAIKAGKSQLAAQATLSHTGAMIGSYDVYEAAFARVGILLVDNLTALFDAAEILCACEPVPGNRLAILTNGGGAGILAVDALAQTDGQLATLTIETIAALAEVTPAGSPRANPVDILGDADADRYAAAVRAILRDNGSDAVLVLNCPTARSDAKETALAICREVAAAAQDRIRKPVLACWLGDANSDMVRPVFAAAGIPVFSTPDDAVRAFGYLAQARRLRTSLTEAPAQSREVEANRVAARAIISDAQADGSTTLSEIKVKKLLEAYGIPVAPTRFAASAEAVEEACCWLSPPYAVKIVSRDLPHKSDVGGVALDLPDAHAAVAAARDMERLIRRDFPGARIQGFAVEDMIKVKDGREMIVGLSNDPTFGPIIMAGAGGVATELLNDKAIDLLPIDHAQARALIARTRMSRRLAEYRNVPAADVESVADVLDAVSAMAVDLPDLLELDINPLIVSAAGVIALDARARIAAEATTASRLILRAAPEGWASDLVTEQGVRFHVRPVRPDDEPAVAAFFDHVSPEDLRFRFMSGVCKVSRDQIVMMTRVDYVRTISFLAFGEGSRLLAVAMLATDPDRTRAEIALTTRTDMKGKGISFTLFEHVLRYAKAEGIETVESIESADHDAALRMERELGFTTIADPDDPTVRIARKRLAAHAS